MKKSNVVLSKKELAKLEAVLDVVIVDFFELSPCGDEEEE